MSFKTKNIATIHIEIDGGTQTREIIDEKAVSEYCEAMQAGTVFPPAVVFYDGSTNWLADGFHRYHAASRAKKQLFCEVRPGTKRDAILYSVGANDTHGIRRSNQTKRNSVLKLLEDAEWKEWSNGEIARRCAVSANFVGEIRSSLSSDYSDNHQESRKYASKNGTVATMNTANIGQRNGRASRIEEPPEPETADDIETYPPTEPTLQERAATATVVRDTIAPKSEPSPPSVTDEEDMTDEDWLMSLPIYKHLVSTGNPAMLLKADCLGWRTMSQTKAFSAFRYQAQKAFNFKATETPLSYLMYRACHVPHPKEWGGCTKCRGKGCTACGYTGATMDGGLTVAQMEAKA